MNNAASKDEEQTRPSLQSTRQGESGVRSFVRLFVRNRNAVFGLAIVLFFVVLAVIGDLLTPYGVYDSARLDVRLQGPSSDHWLGTDDVGRDLLSRLMFASRLSLVAALQAVTVAMVIGIPLGLIAGYYGGRIDTVLMRLTDTIMVFPTLILAIAIVAVLGAGLTNAMIAIGLTFSPYFARIVRGSTLAAREEAYVEASWQLGASTPRLLVRHILPNIVSPILVETTLSLGKAIIAEASLSFLGLGARPPEASWGSMLRRGFGFVRESPSGTVIVGCLIVVVVLSFNMIGDALRAAIGREVHSGDQG